MPNNRHRAIKQYKRSRYKQRLRSAARKTFAKAYCMGSIFPMITEFVKGRGIDYSDLMIIPSDHRSVQGQLRVFAAARASDFHSGSVHIVTDEPGLDLNNLPQGSKLSYQEFVDKLYKDMLFGDKGES